MGPSEDNNGSTQVHYSMPFRCPLPDDADDSSWDKSPLRHPFEWSPVLQAFAVTLSNFDYPAALFWGPGFSLLLNQGWKDVGGVFEQGKSQVHSMSAEAWQALSKVVRGGKSVRTDSHALLRKERGTKDPKFTVLLSPLFEDDPSKPVGVLAQMLCMADDQPASTKRSNHDAGMENGTPPCTNWSSMNPSDIAALDEHPFFQQFAELLPTGLAILDQNARAIFVNQHFYQLTTHRSDDKSFRSWPQSIHPDDYERVLGA
ncbi:hypothetical protein LTR95_014339 [Oleoguttula sp. CCFEE 5521]